MWTVALNLVLLGVSIQVPSCSSSCEIYYLLAKCSHKNLSSVPALPPNITILYLEFNSISEISRSSFRNLEQVQELDLGNQSVPLLIKNHSFLRLNKLERLILGRNPGLRLEPKALAGLFRLTYLDLSGCDLTDSILAQNFLQPLLSLKKLELSFNKIRRLRPGRFFSNLQKFTELELKLNQISSLCEEDLVGFQGKYFTRFNLNSNKLDRMFGSDFNLEQCGNPFREMAFNTLDISGNGLNINASRLFFKAIEGTRIDHLINSGRIGKGFSHNNFQDPDESMFEGLRNSAVDNLDMSGNWIFALNKAVFRHFKNATIISVSKNKINQINRDAFSGLKENLKMLNLSFNLLGEIYSHTFTHLKELRVLDLSFNYVGVLGYQAFWGLPNLQRLYLEGNSLRNLGFPALLPSLELLFLGDNKLESLYGVEHFSRSIHYLDVMDNKLRNMGDVYVTIRNLKNLTQFFFGGNSIKWCTVGESAPLNNSLLGLDLHDSYLQMIWTQGSCLDIFDHLNNLRGLNLSYNSLTSLPREVFRGLSSILVIDLSANTLTYLESEVFPVSLVALDLSNNFLATPDPAAFHSISFIDLATNRIHCDCNLESFLTWLNVTNVTFMSPIELFTCEFPGALHGVPLLNYSKTFEPCDMDDETTVQELRFSLFILLVILVTTVTLSGIFYARLRGQVFIIYKKVVGRVLDGPKQPPPADQMQFDAFLCFSNTDYRWVETALLKKLDKQFSDENLLHCCFEARDFLPGDNHLANIRDAIWGSRKTICIVSREFLKDGWCLEAFALAQGRKLEELRNILIMLVVGKVRMILDCLVWTSMKPNFRWKKVPHYQLIRHDCIRAFVQNTDYLTWPEDPQDLDWFYERLISQILRETKVKRPVEDRPEPVDEDGLKLEEFRAVAQ